MFREYRHSNAHEASRITVALVRENMVFTSQATFRNVRHRRGYIRIYRGCYLCASILQSCTNRYDIDKVIEVARIIALSRLKPACVPTGVSAAVMHGLPTTSSDGTVYLRTQNRRCTTKAHLPEVTFEGKVLAKEAIAKVHHRPHVGPTTTRILDIVCDRLDVATMVGSLIHDRITAFSLACTSLQWVSRFNKWKAQQCHREAERSRQHLLALIRSLPKTARDTRKARWVLHGASPACDSPGEARLLALLMEAGFSGMEMQHPIARTDADAPYFVDIAFPRQHVALEFDGRAKYGTTVEDIHRAEEKENRRQREIEALGWTVIRVRWTDFSHADALLSQVERHLKAADRQWRRRNQRRRSMS
ncbi:endonuclease domain-containing protein [Schaalia suimastitidis]|uniref:endonuclease domain-containing protein n=1 Tax=Schaalia suimastitidis TaxID=121163 RepID=UPI00040B53FB|nr:hypothetical protein [Schaalia suimastitidis]